MCAATITESQVRESLKAVNDPEIGRSLVDLDMVGPIEIGAGNAVSATIHLPTPAYPRRERISQAIQAVLSAKIPGIGHVDVKFDAHVKGKQSGGAIGLRAQNVIAVGSGKGGVGKSTVAASLAVGLQLCGARVGLMDADIYGPSIPHLLGVSGPGHRPEIAEEQGPDGKAVRRIQPIDAEGLKVMSIGFLVGPDEPIIVRGPILHGTIRQFLAETAWGELDYLIIDLPPGTGDIALTLSQLLGLAGAVVVCTPQQLALLDAVKAINMFRKVKIPVLGLVENMSGDIFGRGGAKQKAAEMHVPFLGEIPIDAQIRVNGDAGRIRDLFAESCPSRGHLMNICEQTAIQIARTLLETPAMPTLEML
ncbi:MAG: Mrp/NBP35 family ATP-binding protein [Planctomycetia bacterium]|nr:Mrp/NBP35 family ATP-binding protein [Planctomycetia bacterium]